MTPPGSPAPDRLEDIEKGWHRLVCDTEARGIWIDVYIDQVGWLIDEVKRLRTELETGGRRRPHQEPR